MRRIFDLAGLEYGRIDFSRASDGIRVWEINNNPTILDEPTLAIESRLEANERIAAQHCDAMLALLD